MLDHINSCINFLKNMAYPIVVFHNFFIFTNLHQECMYNVPISSHPCQQSISFVFFFIIVILVGVGDNLTVVLISYPWSVLLTIFSYTCCRPHKFWIQQVCVWILKIDLCKCLEKLKADIQLIFVWTRRDKL